MGHGLSGHSNSSSAASQTVINQRRVWGQSAKLLRNSSMTPRVGKELDDKIDFILFGPRKWLPGTIDASIHEKSIPSSFAVSERDKYLISCRTVCLSSWRNEHKSTNVDLVWEADCRSTASWSFQITMEDIGSGVKLQFFPGLISIYRSLIRGLREGEQTEKVDRMKRPIEYASQFGI